jgi:hypothetical protein
MKNNIITGLIFFSFIVFIIFILNYMIETATKDYCTHTQLQELQKSGDYYSCLGVK